MTERQEQTAARLLASYELVQRLAFPILVGVAAWLFTSAFDHESRLTTIEASRYTPVQASADQAGIREELARIREQLAASQAREGSTRLILSEIKAELVHRRKNGDE